MRFAPWGIQNWLILAMAGMLVLAAVFWLGAVSGFSLSYGACKGPFALVSEFARCRRPVVFSWLFWICVVASVACGSMALARLLLARRRRRRD